MNELLLHVEAGTPARIDSNRAARLLGMASHDIPTLVRGHLLKPLGAPSSNAPKYFAACEVIRLANDPQWLDRATRAITLHWKRKNSGRVKQQLSHAAQPSSLGYQQ